MTHTWLGVARFWIPGMISIGLSGLTLACAVGCSSLNMFNRNSGLDDAASISDVKGPLERNLMTTVSNSQTRTKAEQASFREYEIAKQLYDAGDYAEAEKRFRKIAERHETDDSGYKRKRGWKNAFSSASQLEASYYDNPLVEDSLFMLAESRYQQKEYPGAESVYIRLLQSYPNTRHLDQSTKRLFDIALSWMQFKATTNEDVQVASLSDTGKATGPQVVQNTDYERPGFFNLSDPTRPWTDTEGRALEALKAIWLNDPTGPLADDALMLTASHFLRIGRYSEAAETFSYLREQFPDSPHLKDAYLLGAHVTQASYKGAAYDEKNLEEARQLKMTALNMFPNLTAQERSRLEAELNQVDEAEVARYFETALFWLGKGRFDAVEMYCNYVINQYPDSKYAGKSRGLLKRLPELKDRNTLVLAWQGLSADDIESIDEPLPARPQAMPQNLQPAPNPPQAMPRERNPYEQPTTPQATPQPAEPPKQAPRYLPTLKMPKFKPIPIPKLWSPAEEQPELESAPPFPGSSPQDGQSGRVQMTLGSE